MCCSNHTELSKDYTVTVYLQNLQSKCLQPKAVRCAHSYSHCCTCSLSTNSTCTHADTPHASATKQKQLVDDNIQPN